ncbi:MAG: hypothetical protein PHN63_03985, partial [Candidatus Omnitrophica bacterium]|nr:hypothetical protein [Candidatus Omnitrophota bacterium]
MKSKIVPFAVALLAVWVLVIIPFKIIGQGFLPPDDAMRHCAKAVSGKEWSDILVLRDGLKTIDHTGWAAILSSLHRVTGWDAHSLVLFSVLSLFIVFSIIPFLFLRYPEAWLVSLIIIGMVATGWFFRLVLGRPFILAMSIFIVWCFVWPGLKERKSVFKTSLLLMILAALFTWIYSQWYLLALPLLALLCAREWRAALAMSISMVAGISLGAVLTGHPVWAIIEPVKGLIMFSHNGQSEFNYMLP